jgi:hypothetical protein
MFGLCITISCSFDKHAAKFQWKYEDLHFPKSVTIHLCIYYTLNKTSDKCVKTSEGEVAPIFHSFIRINHSFY